MLVISSVKMQYKECPLKLNGMKLNETEVVKTVKDEYVTLINSEGHPLRINKVDLTEIIRENMPVATQFQKGLLNADSDRFVKAKGFSITDKSACIKLYSAVGQTAVVAFITTGRIEGNVCSTYLLSFSMASMGTYSCTTKKLNDGSSAKFYYAKDGNKVAIYLVSSVDYSVTHISPLLESGNFAHHLIPESLPEGAILIETT